MAQKVSVAMPGSMILRDFTMNDTDIGENQFNRNQADVELIQFFLWQFYRRERRLFSLLPSAGASDFIIDGVCGRQTKSGISVFQKYIRKLGNSIRTDGVVDATKHLLTGGNPALYTIWWLNSWFFENGTGEPLEKENLERHPVVLGHAPHLATELRRRRAPRVVV